MRLHKNNLRIIVVILSLFIIMLFAISIYNYFSVEIKTNFTTEEYNSLLSEYNLKIPDRIVYAYNQASDRYGVRVALMSYNAEDICNCFSTELDFNKLSVDLKTNEWSEYINSNGHVVKSKEISQYILDPPSSKMFIYLFEENANWYIEVEKFQIDNVL